MKSKKSSQPEIGSSLPVVLSTAPVQDAGETAGVLGLTGKMAHGRAADIVNVWDELGTRWGS